MFSLFLFSNLTIPNIQFISWPNIVHTHKYEKQHNNNNNKTDSFGDPLFVCVMELFISSAPFSW